MSTEKPDPTGQRILDAALRLVETRGAPALRMKDVALAAKVSRQAVYLHFGSRSGLFVALMEHVDATRGLAELKENLLAARTPLQLLKAALELQADYFPRIYSVALSLECFRHSDEAAAAAWQDRMSLRRKEMRRTIDWLAAEGLLREKLTVERASDLLWSLNSLPLWQSLVLDCGWSKTQYVEHLFRVLCAALVRSPDPSRSSR